jgi:hypothetical protein
MCMYSPNWNGCFIMCLRKFSLFLTGISKIGNLTDNYTIYNEKYFSERQFSYIVRVLIWRAWRRVELPVLIAKMSWIRLLDTPSSCSMNARRRHMGGEKVRTASLLQSSGLVRTVGPPCAQRRGASGHSWTSSTKRRAVALRPPSLRSILCYA